MTPIQTRTGFLLLALAVPATGYAAEGITGIKTDPATAKVGQPVKIIVSGDPDQKFCGMRVEFGDGDGTDVKIDGDEGLFPRTLTRTYGKAGNFTVSAKGKRVTTHFPCGGEAKVALVVEGAAAGAAKPAAAMGAGASCPAGWMMKGKAGKDGSFSCMPQMPAAKIDCGPGLAYFESGATVGCRKAKK